MPYIPHTEEDKKAMLTNLQIESSEHLFDEIPPELLYSGFQHIPSGLNEMEMLKLAQLLSGENQNGLCFMGAGSYEHHIPAAVWDICNRGEFLTSYTPYQAEASQGTLQLLYEFQTMIAELTGMEVSNASMYDGASALAEAVLMAVRLKKNANPRVLVAGSLHPLYRQTLQTIVSNQFLELITIPFDEKKGIIDLPTCEPYLHPDNIVLIIPQPNFFGCLEEVDALTAWAEKNNILTIACVNPTALALFKPPGEWGNKGVDIVCGEGQPLGVPLASGGPYFGFLSTRLEYVRQLPGRLIGKTVDKEGKMGFSLTLQAREQHIRRSKANSNICTNQGLLVTAATIYMSLLGPQGLRKVAIQSHKNTAYLMELACSLPQIKRVFPTPFFHEVLLQLDRDVEEVLTSLRGAGIQGGFPVGDWFPSLKNTLLVCVTEMRTKEEIEFYFQTLKTILTKG